jgi:hypothetical protein
VRAGVVFVVGGWLADPAIACVCVQAPVTITQTAGVVFAIDREGHADPLPFAQVEILAVPSDALVATAGNSADGTFIVSSLSPGRYRVRASAGGFATTVVPIVFRKSRWWRRSRQLAIGLEYAFQDCPCATACAVPPCSRTAVPPSCILTCARGHESGGGAATCSVQPRQRLKAAIATLGALGGCSSVSERTGNA